MYYKYAAKNTKIHLPPKTQAGGQMDKNNVEDTIIYK